jgi:disulfide oxidoreductase YuzD
MKFNDISIFRLINQQICNHNFSSAKDVVDWMCAMQAQDFEMAKWAIGVRFSNSNVDLVQNSIDKGEILRTHLLRPTWHFVSAEDILWILKLTAPRIKASLKHRQIYLELSQAILMKSQEIISRALINKKSLTREELKIELEKAKVPTDNNRLTHILVDAELEGIICSGADKRKKRTYALLSDRINNRKRLTKDESLAELTNRYFLSHGPATLNDFVWWSGLSIRDARHGLETVKSNFFPEKINSTIYWFSDSFSITENYKKSTFLLPAYDEFVISYKDRTAIIQLQYKKKAISNNGIFYPLIVTNGKVIGIWNRKTKNEKVNLEIKLFQLPTNKIKRSITDAAEKFGYFAGKKIEIEYKII